MILFFVFDLKMNRKTANICLKLCFPLSGGYSGHRGLLSVVGTAPGQAYSHFLFLP